MSDMPLTRVAANKKRQAHIRNAVRKAEKITDIARIARPDDVAALTDLLADPEVSTPIYTLPETINKTTVESFIKQHLSERERGEGLLMISVDDSGVVNAYHDIQIWPQWSACELGGAIRRGLQSSGKGGTDAAVAFNWLFDVIGVDLICETAALDNVRTARLLERIGFSYKGEITSKRPEGGFRPSHYWELGIADWQSHSQSTVP